MSLSARWVSSASSFSFEQHVNKDDPSTHNKFSTKILQGFRTQLSGNYNPPEVVRIQGPCRIKTDISFHAHHLHGSRSALCGLSLIICVCVWVCVWKCIGLSLVKGRTHTHENTFATKKKHFGGFHFDPTAQAAAKFECWQTIAKGA